MNKLSGNPTGTLKPSPVIAAIIEARMASTRLPGKVLLPAAGRPLLEHLIARLSSVAELDNIVVATTRGLADDAIVRVAQHMGVHHFRGSESDVMGRVLQAADSVGAQVIVEITGDCPLIDPMVVSRAIRLFSQGEFDYVSNLFPRIYPLGMDTQVFATEVLREVEQTSRGDAAAREHVSLPIYEQPERFRLGNFHPYEGEDAPEMALTLDTSEDYQLIRTVFEELGPQCPELPIQAIIQFLRARPELQSINLQVVRKAAR